MLLRDRLRARLSEMGTSPDYVRLAADVLGIRNAPPALARRLVDQALVVEDRRDEWLRRGEHLCQAAPQAPGVYVLRDADARALYVGKANNLHRRLRTHFAARRWRQLKADFTRATHVEWQVVGSEVEALIREAVLIRSLAPIANVQVGAPQVETRAVPGTLRRDAVIVLPSSVEHAVELLAVRASGPVLFVRVRRDGKGLRARVSRLWRFFAQSGDSRDARPAASTARESRDARTTASVALESQGAGVVTTRGESDEPAERNGQAVCHRGSECESRDEWVADACAPLVWSWLAGRGASATRLDPRDAGSAREFERRVRLLLKDETLFSGRIVVVRSACRAGRVRSR